jgi:hypothetical protein
MVQRESNYECLPWCDVEDYGVYDLEHIPHNGWTMTNRETNVVTHFKRDGGLHTAIPNNPREFQFVETVVYNKKYFTKTQIDRADRARKMYQSIGYPSLKDFLHVLQTNQVKDCPVTVEDVKIAQKIYGPDIYALKG